MAYQVLAPTNLQALSRIEGVVVVDSFTSLRRPWRQALGAVLNDLYAETGRVVAGIAVPGASFAAVGRRRFGYIVAAAARVSPAWIVLVSMGNDAYDASMSLPAVVDGIREVTESVSGICPVFVAYGGASWIWRYPPWEGYDGRVLSVCQALAAHALEVGTGVLELQRIPQSLLVDRVGHYSSQAYPYVLACIRAWVLHAAQLRIPSKL